VLQLTAKALQLSPIMNRILLTGLVVVSISLASSLSIANQPELFVIEGKSQTVVQVGGDNNLVDLVGAFIEADDRAGFGLMVAIEGFSGKLNYLGVPDALLFVISDLGKKLTLSIPSINIVQTFHGANTDDLSDQVVDWLKTDGLDDWSAFLHEMNGSTPLALLSGNPKSTVAIMGDSAYRKFGFDNSRSRMGFGEVGEIGEVVKRWGGFELRVDASVGAVSTSEFDDDLWAIDPSITLKGEFGRHLGLSFSLVSQYRNYDGAKLADAGGELALPITLKRPDNGPWFWQITPFLQAGAGVSIDFAAGGLFLGGGIVNSLGWNRGPFEVLMSNEIAYYGGLPIDDIGGYNFNTDLSQLYFKNGLEGTYRIGAGFYADAGIHFSNFAIDEAAVSWFATPTIGVGWEWGRWMDIRCAYEADVSNDYNYRGHNFQLKLDFLF
jgi:hypothetical protein